MTPDDAYNIGFLAGCAEAGLNGTEATALHAKTAATKQALGGIGTLAGAVAGPIAAPRKRKMEGLGHGVAQGLGWDVGGALGAGSGAGLGAMLAAALRARGTDGSVGGVPLGALAIGGGAGIGYALGGETGRRAVGGLTGPAPWDDKQEKHADMNDLIRGGLFSALATGTVVGGGIGAGLGVMARPDPLKNDNAPLVRNLQQAELVAALRQHASRARQTATVLRAKAETPPPRSVFGI
jgi:hypothetical protein